MPVFMKFPDFRKYFIVCPVQKNSAYIAYQFSGNFKPFQEILPKVQKWLASLQVYKWMYQHYDVHPALYLENW